MRGAPGGGIDAPAAAPTAPPPPPPPADSASCSSGSLPPPSEAGASDEPARAKGCGGEASAELEAAVGKLIVRVVPLTMAAMLLTNLTRTK